MEFFPSFGKGLIVIANINICYVNKVGNYTHTIKVSDYFRLIQIGEVKMAVAK